MNNEVTSILSAIEQVGQKPPEPRHRLIVATSGAVR
jgi:hypothetical protein